MMIDVDHKYKEIESDPVISVLISAAETVSKE